MPEAKSPVWRNFVFDQSQYDHHSSCASLPPSLSGEMRGMSQAPGRSAPEGNFRSRQVTGRTQSWGKCDGHELG